MFVLIVTDEPWALSRVADRGLRCLCTRRFSALRVRGGLVVVVPEKHVLTRVLACFASCLTASVSCSTSEAIEFQVPLVVGAVRALHDELAGRGWSTWPMFDIAPVARFLPRGAFLHVRPRTRRVRRAGSAGPRPCSPRTGCQTARRSSSPMNSSPDVPLQAGQGRC